MLRKLLQRQAAFVHIGFPKTGTTSLQAFLHHNSIRLARHGTLYPETGKYWHAQHELAGLFQTPEKRLAWLTTDFNRQYLNDLREELAASGAKKLILSSEAFSLTDKHMEFKEFLGELGFAKPKIICFFRRQDLWAESAFTQLYKTAEKGFDFAEYATNPRLNYSSFLESWEAAFGLESLAVDVLDGRAGNRDILPLACDILEIRYLLRSYQPKKINARLAPDALHYSHVLHKNSQEPLIGWLIEILEEYTRLQAEDTGRYVFMLDQDRLEFLSRFEESNRILAERYLGCDQAFESFEGFSKKTYLCPGPETIDLNDVANYVLTEVKRRAVIEPGPLWQDRLDFLIDQNEELGVAMTPR